MADLSSYINYLPPVLWSQENDPSQFLGRMLRIFEKILTGIEIDAQVVRAQAKIANAASNRIQVTNTADASTFRPGDIVTIEGTTERVQIDRIEETALFLTTPLTGTHSNGIVRIADLVAGQTTFRVDHGTGLGQGIPINLVQGANRERVVIAQIHQGLITLKVGLGKAYPMAATDLPIVIQDAITLTRIDAQVVRTQATIANAANNQIQVTNIVDASTFRPGDIVTIEGTTERVQIDRIEGTALFLTTPLTGTHSSGTVRIANLAAGQTTFRVDHGTGLGQGIPINLVQGANRERVVIAQIHQGLITLKVGLGKAYPMAATDLPIVIQDAITLTRGDPKYQSLEATIDQLTQIFNPWQTPPEFLPWLASWTALSLQSDWSEYQQRKLLSEIVSIYQQRGLKRGLQTYLDLYSATKAKPRIVIDDGEAVFRAAFAADGTAQLYTVAHSNTIFLPAILVNEGRPDSKVTVLLHPSAIAVDSKNNYIIADQGGDAEPSPPAIWKMSSTGDVPYQSSNPASMPMPKSIHSGVPLKIPTAVVVDDQDRYHVVDIGDIRTETSVLSAIFRFSPPDYSLSTLIGQSTNPKFPAVHPVDMVLDTSTRFSGRSSSLVVLDRGRNPAGNPPQFGAADPKLVIVSENPLAVTVKALKKEIEPTALAIAAQGYFIVADAREPRSSNAPIQPADLIRVDPSADPNAEWTQTSILGSLPADQNPLIFPTGLAFENPQSLLVCDTGVRRRTVGDRSNRAMAEPPAIYRVDLSQNPPVITRITDQKTLVNPTKITFDRNGELIIADRGEALRLGLGSDLRREWRTRPNEFGVMVLFSAQRPTQPEERNRIRLGIANVIEAQKPGHTSCWLEI